MQTVSPVKDLQIRLGSDIAIARKRRGVSLSEMAHRLAVTRNTYRKLESGESVGTELFLMTLWILGLSDRMEDLLAPLADERALRQELAELPRKPRRARRPKLIDPRRMNF